MQALLAFSRIIDAINTTIGKAAGWLILAAVAISAGNALIRKILGTSSNAWLELQWYLFGAVFMLCAGYTLLKDAHVRIDIVALQFSKRKRDWADVIGHILFLLPLCALMLYEGIPFFLRSLASSEYSGNPGGLILWPAKLLVPLGFALLALQGLSELIKRIAIMRGLIEDPAEAAETAEATPATPGSDA